ncbi:MAG: caspase family protein [Fimbriimonas sp.]
MKKALRLATLAALGLAAVAAHAETYAVMVGINDYPEPKTADGKPMLDKDGKPIVVDLSGCVNDVKNYNDLLVNKFGVKSDNVKLILNGDASQKGFIDGMKWLLGTAKAGDQIIFVYSGHGTQMDDKEEEDGKGEAIVLADNTLVTGKFFNELSRMTSKAGMNATFVFDSCYSGGMTRDAFSFDGKPGQARKRFTEFAHLAKPKFFTAAQGAELKAIPKAAPQAPAGSYMFLLAGREDQPTTDLDFKDEKTPDRGLFSLIFGLLLDENPNAPVEALMKATVDLLKEKGFSQVPQFELSSADRGKKPFFLK